MCSRTSLNTSRSLSKGSNLIHFLKLVYVKATVGPGPKLPEDARCAIEKVVCLLESYACLPLKQGWDTVIPSPKPGVLQSSQVGIWKEQIDSIFTNIFTDIFTCSSAGLRQDLTEGKDPLDLNHCSTGFLKRMGQN